MKTKKIVGWYKMRRDTPHSVLYSIEKRVCSKMIQRDPHSTRSFLFILNTSESQKDAENRYTKLSEHHQALLYDMQNSFEPIRIRIQNISTINLRHDQQGKVDDNVTKSEENRRQLFMVTRFEDESLKRLSESIREQLERTYAKMQEMCQRLNEKLRELLSGLVRQEYDLVNKMMSVDSSQSMTNDQKMKELLNAAILKSIADELSG